MRLDLPLADQVEKPFILELVPGCMAVLIGPRVLATAAHCIVYDRTVDLEIISPHDGGSKHTDAQCVVEDVSPPKSWSNQSCSTNAAHDRALCYLTDLTAVDLEMSWVPVGTNSGTPPLAFGYHGNSKAGWRLESAIHHVLGASCEATGTVGCDGWSGTPSYVTRPGPAFVATGVLSEGIGCPPSSNTEAAFSSLMDPDFDQLLRSLATAAGVTEPQLGVARASL